MQSARHRSERIAAIASMSPLMRPALTPARTPSGVGRLHERLEPLAVVVVECLDRSGEFGVGCRLERAVEQSEGLHPVLRLIHVARRYLRAQETT
jgi:hypothetical protein